MNGGEPVPSSLENEAFRVLCLECVSNSYWYQFITNRTVMIPG